MKGLGYVVWRFIFAFAPTPIPGGVILFDELEERSLLWPSRAVYDLRLFETTYSCHAHPLEKMEKMNFIIDENFFVNENFRRKACSRKLRKFAAEEPGGGYEGEEGDEGHGPDVVYHDVKG